MAPTSFQAQHEGAARHNTDNYASHNGGHPANAAGRPMASNRAGGPQPLAAIATPMLRLSTYNSPHSNTSNAPQGHNSPQPQARNNPQPQNIRAQSHPAARRRSPQATAA